MSKRGLLQNALNEVRSDEAIREINSAIKAIRQLVLEMNTLDWEEGIIKKAAKMAEKYQERDLMKSLQKLLVGNHIISDINKKGENRSAALLGRKGGLKGGRARMAKLTPERRKEIAKNAAKIRWANYKLAKETEKSA